MAIQDLANNPIASGTTGQMLGYTEPAAPEEMLPLRLYNFLLYPIRQADATREGVYFVKRLFEGPQAVWQKTQEKIFALKDLWSITKCPDEALIYLKNIVGWTSDLEYITDELDSDTLRRLIAASVPLWRRRGREETTLNVLALVANARCLLWNYFDYRWIVGETEFSELRQGFDSWMIDSGDFLGEYDSTLRIVDDGNLNHALVRNIVKFMRATGERIEIAYIDFLDQFLTDGDNSQWNTITGSLPTVEDGYGELDATSAAQHVTAETEYSDVWTRYIAYYRVSGKANTFGVTFYVVGADDYYGFSLNIGVAPNYELFRYVGGVKTSVTTGNLTFSLIEDVWYGIRIHVEPHAISGNHIKVYLDNDEIIDVDDTGSGYPSKGPVGFFADSGSQVKLSECELFQLPLETVLIDINS